MNIIRKPIAVVRPIEEPRAADYDDVHDQASFVDYVSVLRGELDDPVLREDWENVDLSSFLGAMIAWSADRRGQANPNPWRHAADILTAATIYRA